MISTTYMKKKTQHQQQRIIIMAKRILFTRRKISDTIKTLRAAFILNGELQQFNTTTSSSKEGKKSRRRHDHHDGTLILFFPLHEDLILNHEHHRSSSSSSCPGSTRDEGSIDLQGGCLLNKYDTRKETEDDNNNIINNNNKDKEDEEYVYDHEIFPVQVEPLHDDCDPPRILNNVIFQQIVDEAIPRSLRMYKWRRIFSIAEHGDLFFTFLQKVEAFKSTLLVLKTTKGHVLGGFASEYWKVQEGFDKRHYFGFGSCFLFSDYQENQNPDKRLSFYKWTGQNDYCQICDADSGKIAMGGGNSEFGLILEDSFLRGSSGHCTTFNNPPLIPGIDGSFDILDFEVYGLLPLIPTVSRANRLKKSTFSNVSLLNQ